MIVNLARSNDNNLVKTWETFGDQVYFCAVNFCSFVCSNN